MRPRWTPSGLMIISVRSIACSQNFLSTELQTNGLVERRRKKRLLLACHQRENLATSLLHLQAYTSEIGRAGLLGCHDEDQVAHLRHLDCPLLRFNYSMANLALVNLLGIGAEGAKGGSGQGPDHFLILAVQRSADDQPVLTHQDDACDLIKLGQPL